MLKSIVYLLVFISLLTTPTRAYEAYDISGTNFVREARTIKASEIFIREPEAADLCRLAIDKAEKTYGIKQNLLQTIASVESGRWNAKKGERVAWPWTAHANGKGYFFSSKAEAVAAVKAMQERGITNIDVGCMQINLKYHGSAFSSLDEAFEPEKNTAYGASFLKKLYSSRKDWTKTAMHYHSKNWQKGTNYKNRLEKHFAKYIKKGSETTLF